MGLIFDSPQHSVLNVLVKCFAKNDYCHHNVSNLTSTYFEPSIFHASFLFLTITLQDIFHHPHYSSEETKTQPANNWRSKDKNLSLGFQRCLFLALQFDAIAK